MESTRHPGGQYFWQPNYNSLLNDLSGAAQLLPHQILGSLALGTNASNNQTVTLDINGTNVVFTMVTSLGSNPGNVLIGASAAATALNLINLIENPQFTTTTGVALTQNNQQLLSYLGFTLVGTTLYIYSINSTIWAPETSFSCSTTVSSGSYTANTMALFVEPGAYWINGTPYTYAGGITPTVTAPVSHPRIDILTIDTSGTLAWTVGSENISPSAPTPPANKTALCELYNVTGETALYDNVNQNSGQGYILADLRFINYQMNPGAITANLIPDSAGGRNLGSSGTPWGTGYFQTVLQNGNPVSQAEFGGTGADGALSVTSGTTTLNASSALSYVKNYTSISITGTGQLAFSTPSTNGTFIALRSQGGVTLTSSTTPNINASAMGAAGGSGGLQAANGTAGSTGLVVTGTNTLGGNLGQFSNGTNAAATASVGSTVLGVISVYARLIRLFTGAGGGGGAGGTNSGVNGGAGGNGGGALLIECAGALNLTASPAISVAGAAGTAGSNGTSVVFEAGGGGGGGAGGSLYLFYNSLTANSGTVSVAGGTGGNGGNPQTGAGGTGGAGGNGTSGNGQSGGGTSGAGNGSGAGGGGSGGGSDSGLSNGSTATNGSASSGSQGGGGGGGASGYSLIALNTWFS